MMHGQHIKYVGFPGTPKEYVKDAIYIALDVLESKTRRHVIRIKRTYGQRYMLSTVDDAHIRED